MQRQTIRRAVLLALVLCAPFAARAEGPTVKRFVVCADVEKRECVGEGRRFGLEVGTVWAYAVVDNRGGEIPVEMVWRRDGRSIFTAEVTVGRSRRWRTWSRKRVRRTDRGGWTVSLRRADMPDDGPLAVIAFAIGESSPVGSSLATSRTSC